MLRQTPNIVLILADDMGYGDIGAFGNSIVETPNIDRLCSEGVRLTQHYSGSPVCAPARAALLTGRYPHRTGAVDTLEGRGLDRMALREVTLADRLKSAGYATGLMGKWHSGALDPRFHPNARGFDEFAGFSGGWSDYWQWRIDYNGRFQSADGRYLTDVFTEESVQFIRRHRDEPFFLHVSYNAPHFPLQVPDEDVIQFRERGDLSEGVSLIYGMNRRMDKGIGRILDELDRNGITDNTIVLFASDNGPDFSGGATARFNGDFNGSKCLVYEGGIRVPAVVRWPDGLDGGRDVGEIVHFTDWLPTLIESTGGDVTASPNLDGRSVLSLLRGGSGPADICRFWQWNRYSPVPTCNAAVRDGKWKLLRPVIHEAFMMTSEDIALDRRLKYEPQGITEIVRGPEPEREIPEPTAPMLFDLEEDPYERNDLADAHPEIVSCLERKFDNWFESVEADRHSIDD